ncbi:MAG: pseudouridine synthase [Chloroflexi bacterium]|nr:pseudouridine synthase [Chloroflexota bacterium]
MMRVLRFWKPYDVLTKFTDADGRATLADYIDAPGIYAAGRLDKDSEGLLILTDAGALNARLTDPAFSHPRVYWVQVERIPDQAALDRLRQGVDLKDGRTRPAQADLLDTPPDLPERPVPVRYRKHVPTAWLQLTITEGRNRQVRRMTAAVGHPTLRLVRWAIGPVTLAGLQPGEAQPLAPNEIDALRRSAFRRR